MPITTEAESAQLDALRDAIARALIQDRDSVAGPSSDYGRAWIIVNTAYPMVAVVECKRLANRIQEARSAASDTAPHLVPGLDQAAEIIRPVSDEPRPSLIPKDGQDAVHQAVAAEITRQRREGRPTASGVAAGVVDVAYGLMAQQVQTGAANLLERVHSAANHEATPGLEHAHHLLTRVALDRVRPPRVGATIATASRRSPAPEL